MVRRARRRPGPPWQLGRPRRFLSRSPAAYVPTSLHPAATQRLAGPYEWDVRVRDPDLTFAVMFNARTPMGLDWSPGLATAETSSPPSAKATSYDPYPALVQSPAAPPSPPERRRPYVPRPRRVVAPPSDEWASSDLAPGHRCCLAGPPTARAVGRAPPGLAPGLGTPGSRGRRTLPNCPPGRPARALPAPKTYHPFLLLVLLAGGSRCCVRCIDGLWPRGKPVGVPIDRRSRRRIATSEWPAAARAIAPPSGAGGGRIPRGLRLVLAAEAPLTPEVRARARGAAQLAAVDDCRTICARPLGES